MSSAEKELERLRKVEEANKKREEAKKNPKGSTFGSFIDSLTGHETGEDTAKRYDAEQENRKKRYGNIFGKKEE
jgi:hypothetical protein